MIKGQASVELLIILAVSMIALGLIFAASNNEITGINSAKANSDAKNTVEKIARTSEEVYSSGQGTKKQIYVVIPSGVDETKTSVSDRTIRLNVNGTDLIAETSIEVTGSIPTKAGGYWIWITAYPGYVFVGDIEVETNKGSIYSTIAQETSAIENISVINNTSGNATVVVSSVWAAAEVSLSLSENSFTVPIDSSYGIDLNFTSSSSAVGNYTGELIFDVNTVDGTKQITVPVTVEVIVGTGEGQPLMIFPDSWSISINPGSSGSKNFQVCNTSDSALTNINFTPSSGDAGNWVQPIPLIASLAGNTCEEITVTIDVPLGASNNTGTVTASDGTNSDFISLSVSVSDVTAPIIMLEAPANGYTSSSFDVQFDYSVNDADSGIAFCELIIDGVVDQTDNTITEGITQSFNKTFSVNGTYNWDVNCTDDSTNSNEGTSGENRAIIINLVQYPIIIAFHDFPNTSWSSGTGWLGAWTHTGDSAITNSGVPYSLPMHLRLRRNTGYAERAVDLSSYSKPRLEFWAKVNSFEASDTALVLVSSNHIDWNIINVFTSIDSDNTYQFYAFDLNVYTLSSSFWIAFDAGMNSTGDYFYIDDVNIVQRTP